MSGWRRATTSARSCSTWPDRGPSARIDAIADRHATVESHQDAVAAQSIDGVDMQMRLRGVAGIANRAERLSGRHRLCGLDGDTALAKMGELDQKSIAG